MSCITWCGEEDVSTLSKESARSSGWVMDGVGRDSMVGLNTDGPECELPVVLPGIDGLTGGCADGRRLLLL
jgi:hypothetical protein